MDKNKIILFIAALLLGMLLIIGGIWFFTREEREESTTPIANYSQNISNLPEETRTGMERSLHGILKINNEGLDPSDVKDSLIREGSNSQEEVGSEQFTGTFIVDIPSLRQSYRLTYSHSSANDGFDSGYPYLATCLEDDEYIYEKFDCKNQQYSDTPSDPLLQKLPHEASNYTIRARGETGIVIQIMLTHTSRTDKFFKSYRASAQQWLVNEGFNLDDYELEYRDIQNNPVTLTP